MSDPLTWSPIRLGRWFGTTVKVHVFLILFVVLAEGIEMDDTLRGRIATDLRRALSPRHVPDAIEAVPAIPRTFTAKKLELPVKRILQGARAEDVASRDALVAPEALDAFVAIAQRRRQPSAA